MPRFFLTFLVAVIFLTGCADPLRVAVSFHQALAQQDGEKAYGLLSIRTQKLLKQRSLSAFQASNEKISSDPTEMITMGDPSIYSEITEPASNYVLTAQYLSLSENTAKVKVTLGADIQQELNLVRENGHWRVDLPLHLPSRHTEARE